MNLDHLKSIRLKELEQVCGLVGPACRILEIGAGSGWQSAWLSSLGHSVQALDLAQPSVYREQRAYEVKEYDGINLPFAEQSFDLIYSSHVMEHVCDLPALSKEMQRVSATGARALHIVPTETWRLYSLLTHYPGCIRDLIRIISSKIFVSDSFDKQSTSGVKRSNLEYLARFLLPHRHGERGNALSELYYFSEDFWREEFEILGWQIKSVHELGILYSGYNLFDSVLSIESRCAIAKVLGSSSRVFELVSKAV